MSFFELADLFPKKVKKSDYSNTVAKLDEIAKKADYKSYIPGGEAWKEIWKANPNLQEEMIEFAKNHPASYKSDYLFCIEKNYRVHFKICESCNKCEKGILTAKFRKEAYEKEESDMRQMHEKFQSGE